MKICSPLHHPAPYQGWPVLVGTSDTFQVVPWDHFLISLRHVPDCSLGLLPDL